MEEDNKKNKAGRPLDTEIMLKRHKMMLEYQKKIAPFTPSLRELETIWYLETNGHLVSSVRSMLLNMKRSGLVVTRKKNNKTSYYAVERQGENNNEQSNQET